MDKTYFLVLTGLILFSITIYNYSPSTPTPLDHLCDPDLPICLLCPPFIPSHNHHGLDVYTYAISKGQFTVLTSVKEITFQKTQCMKYLKTVTPSLSLKSKREIESFFKVQKVTMKRSLSVPMTDYHFSSFKDFGDFLVFTKNEGSVIPVVYTQAQHNSQNLLKYVRIMGWSSLLALIIASAISLCGFNLFLIHKSKLPLLQLLTVASSLISSNQGKYFEYFGVVQAMYLITIYLRLDSASNHSKVCLLLWATTCIFYSNFVLLGQIWIFQTLYSNQSNEKKTSKIIVWLIAIGLFLRILSFIPWNFLQFTNILWSIIFFPIILLILQAMPQNGYLQVTQK